MTRDRLWAEDLIEPLSKHRGLALSWGVFGLIWDGPAEQWIGALYAVLERWEEAAHALEAGLAGAGVLGARPAAARIRGQLARVYLSTGDDRAGELFDRAEQEARELGMVHLLSRIEAARSSSVSLPAAGAAPRALEIPSLLREGDVWSIRWSDAVVRLKHSRALEMLERLIANAGREIHVLELGTDATEAMVTTACTPKRARPAPADVASSIPLPCLLEA